MCSDRAPRGERGRRAVTERPRNLGGPAWCLCRSRRGQRLWGIHNPQDGRGRESERLIVVRKRGNARGAKGPHFSRVSIQEGSVDWAAKLYERLADARSPRGGCVLSIPLFSGVGTVPQGQAGAVGRACQAWQRRPPTPCACLVARDCRGAGCGKSARPVRRGGAGVCAHGEPKRARRWKRRILPRRA